MNRNPERLMQSLPALSSRAVPADMRLRLRVLASREQVRQMSRRNFRARAEALRERLQRLWDNFLSPLALPFTGGVAAAIVLFSMLVPAYPLKSVSAAGSLPVDVPTMLTTEVEVRGTSPFVTSSDEVVVDVWVDGQGRMFDYAIVAGATVLANSQLRRRLENMLLFTQFTPATEFGQPTASKVRLRLGSSRIDVRG
jgi:hypothetical protein